MTVSLSKYDRQLPLFGEVGQQKIRDTRIAIVGFGGLGTHIYQSLLLLGVLHIMLIEPETFDETNRNRYIGFTDDDIGRHKLDAALRIAKSMNPKAQVDLIRAPLETVEAFTAIKKANVVFGTLDHDGPRAVLNELCVAYGVPLIDLASEISKDGASFGGRVYIVSDGAGCLHCIGDGLDPDEVRRYFSTAENLENEATIYGVPVSDLQARTGPSVVSINGQIANMAVTEFMMMVTEMQSFCRAQNYRIHLRQISKPGKKDGCIVCQTHGTKENAGVERYLRFKN
jgi:molybdopterin/thiamine biosynthesis adenylyltransferase